MQETLPSPVDIGPTGASTGGERVDQLSRSVTVAWLLTFVEILIVIVAGWYATREWRNLNPQVVPVGGEFLGAIQINYLWALARECGLCALWYGGAMGGFPSFAEPTGSQLYPVVALTSLVWGTINGAKIALSLAFIIAGLAQWWLGWALQVGRAARLWAALLAIVAAHIAARMQMGNFSLVMSTAACSLLLAPLILVSRSERKAWVVVLALILAQAAVSGHLYIQLAFIFALPSLVFLLPWTRAELMPVLRRYVVAAALGLLLAAPFLLPFFHFLPQVAKDADANFSATQPFAYVPLNLVIDDLSFYQSEALGKKAFPSHYVNFIGWIPVLLALWGLTGLREKRYARVTAFLAAFAVLVLWAAAAGPQMLLGRFLPIPSLTQLLSGARYTSFMAGLAVPAILGLSAIGLQRILSLDWPRIVVGATRSQSTEKVGRGLSIDLRWLMLIPLAFSLAQARSFSQNWIATQPLQAEVLPIVGALATPRAEWVNTPFGEMFWTTPAVERGLKLARSVYWTWHWEGRKGPEPQLEAHRQDPPAGMQQRQVVSNVRISAAPNREYAVAADSTGGQTVCSAQARGGHIDVQCDSPGGGILTVQENNWTGWQATVNGEPTAVAPGPWLTVPVPPGASTVQFRYRPWDVPLGFVLAGLGVAALGVIAWRAWKGRTRPAPSSASGVDTSAP